MKREKWPRPIPASIGVITDSHLMIRVVVINDEEKEQSLEGFQRKCPVTYGSLKREKWPRPIPASIGVVIDFLLRIRVVVITDMRKRNR